jgi:hypothetical protein
VKRSQIRVRLDAQVIAWEKPVIHSVGQQRDGTVFISKVRLETSHVVFDRGAASVEAAAS